MTDLDCKFRRDELENIKCQREDRKGGEESRDRNFVNVRSNIVDRVLPFCGLSVHRAPVEQTDS